MKPSVAGEIRHLSTSLPEISLPALAPMTGLDGAQSRSHLSAELSFCLSGCFKPQALEASILVWRNIKHGTLPNQSDKQKLSRSKLRLPGRR
jgi:hypothetical protein